MAYRRGLAFLVVTGLFVTQPRSVSAVPKAWTGATGLWTDGNNWNPAGQPQAGDDVTIGSGSADLAVNTMVASLTLSGGELTRSGTLTASGVVTWTAGMMSGSGMTVAMAGMGLGGSSKVLSQRTVVLAGGTATMSTNVSAIPKLATAHAADHHFEDQQGSALNEIVGNPQAEPPAGREPGA